MPHERPGAAPPPTPAGRPQQARARRVAAGARGSARYGPALGSTRSPAGCWPGRPRGSPTPRRPTSRTRAAAAVVAVPRRPRRRPRGRGPPPAAGGEAVDPRTDPALPARQPRPHLARQNAAPLACSLARHADARQPASRTRAVDPLTDPALPGRADEADPSSPACCAGSPTRHAGATPTDQPDPGGGSGRRCTTTSAPAPSSSRPTTRRGRARRSTPHGPGPTRPAVEASLSPECLRLAGATPTAHRNSVGRRTDPTSPGRQAWPTAAAYRRGDARLAEPASTDRIRRDRGKFRPSWGPRLSTIRRRWRSGCRPTERREAAYLASGGAQQHRRRPRLPHACASTHAPRPHATRVAAGSMVDKRRPARSRRANRPSMEVSYRPSGPPGAPWQRLYFLPEPQGQGALRDGPLLDAAD